MDEPKLQKLKYQFYDIDYYGTADYGILYAKGHLEGNLKATIIGKLMNYGSIRLDEWTPLQI